MLSPDRCHPIFFSLAVVSEYINGFSPRLYRDDGFDKFVIVNLKYKCINLLVLVADLPVFFIRFHVLYLEIVPLCMSISIKIIS